MDKNKVLTRSIEQILPSRQELEKLMNSKKIRVYLGVDPTGIHLHLGHMIPMRKLQEFAELGHEAILLFGTGTVLAGDPSQRTSARPKITQEEIDENIKTWKQQVAKIIDFNKVQIKQNGDWLLKLQLADVINIASNLSASQLIKRDMFQKRLKRKDTIWFHETMYPMLQGYDSVAMDVDAEIGGTDQTFNMLVGRELMKKMKGKEKFVITTPLILGTDGNPMSKSSGNCIWLDDTASDMFAKIMSMSDTQIPQYWTNLTDLDPTKLTSLKPLDAKKQLAHEIVKSLHDQYAADTAQKEFASVHQKGGLPQDVETTVESGSLIDALVKLTESKSQAKRLLDQGAVEIGGKVASDGKMNLKSGQILKVGKKKFAKVR